MDNWLRRDAHAADLAFALESAHMFAWDWNLTTGTAQRTANATQLHGLPDGSIEEFYRVVHPDDRAHVRAAVARAREGEVYDLEYRITAADGRVLWMLDKGKVRHDPVTGEEHLSGLCMDITERKLAEEERRQARETLHNLIAAAPLGIAILDRDLRFRHLNAPLAEMNGLAIGAHLGHTVGEIVPSLEAQVGQHVDHVLATGVAGPDVVIEGETPKAPGIKRAWRQHWFPVAGTDGKPALAGVIVQEITEQLRDQDRLRLLSEAAALILQSDEPGEMLSQLFANIGPHFALDVYINFLLDESGEALQLNASAGISAAEQQRIARVELGESVCGRVAQHGEPLVLDHIQQTLDPCADLVRSFGLRVYASHPLLSNGKVLGTLSFGSRSKDVLDASEIEFLHTITRYVAVAYERSRLIDKLRETDRRKDEFLATLAHELRNPLAPIRNSIQVLRISGNNAQRAENSLRIMERQLGQMVHLIDDLLDVSRITRGRIELRKELISLTAAIYAAVETVQPLIDASGQTLTISLPSEPLRLYADKTRLTQIFSNLLGNAHKYTQRGGHIWLSAAVRGAQVMVSVRDDGIGIARDHLAEVFTMFSQVAPARERSQGGLGIGLSLVKGLVELHGGSVSVHSGGPGQGSEFQVCLPLSAAPSAAVEETPAAPGSAVGVPALRILVVDDNVDSAESLATLLAMKGHEVRSVHDGAQAVEAARQYQPQLALLDIGLPTLNGYEVAKRIRQQQGGERMALVAVTGWGQEEDKRLAVEAGFDWHLTKPVDPSDIDDLLVSMAFSSVKAVT